MSTVRSPRDYVSNFRQNDKSPYRYAGLAFGVSLIYSANLYVTYSGKDKQQVHA